jgi:S1-C subfamily serine protease
MGNYVKRDILQVFYRIIVIIHMYHKKINILHVLWVGLVVSLTLVSCTTSNDVNPFADNRMSEAAKSVVLVESFDDNRVPYGYGSGTIIDTQGYILTSFHVVGDLKTGALDNPDGITRIYVTNDYREPPEFRYYAQVIEYNQNADLAVLRIIRLKSGDTPKQCLELPALSINNREMNIGDAVHALGYPSLGGRTITATSGRLAGYDYVVDILGIREITESMKIDAMLSPGVSGGALISDDYELVGVPNYRYAEISGQVGFAKSVQLLGSLVDDAKMNDVPGCDDAAPVQLQREPATFPAHYLKGNINYGEFKYGAVFLFDASIDVTQLNEQEVRQSLLYRRFGSDGYFSIPLADEAAGQEEYGIVLVIDGKSVLRLNNQQLKDFYDSGSGYGIEFE